MHLPRATYRLQFNADFGFAEAGRWLGYLRQLGVSDIYASPVFAVRPGSNHGYDVVDPAAFNDELGGREGFEALREKAARAGLNWLQDIVPNHMAYDGRNARLMEILESGPASRSAAFFDIDWQHFSETLRGRLLAPFLGEPYGEALENGLIRLHFDAGGFFFGYYGWRLPLAMESYAEILEPVAAALRHQAGREAPDFIKLMGLIYLLRPLGNGDDPAERREQLHFIKALLTELHGSNPDIRRLLVAEMQALNGTPGQPRSFDRLEALLGRQHYRLAFWKVATEELNYRRFFNINDLLGVRVQDQDVFSATHSLVALQVGQGNFQGLRVDHVDGLYDPLEYLRRLRAMAQEAYLVVEKILGPGESLPGGWPVAGTTGYDFLNMLLGLFVDTAAQGEFDRLHDRHARNGAAGADPALRVAEKKRLIIGKEMAGDVENLAQRMKQVAGRSRHGSDVTLFGLKRAIVEVLAFFPVYRSYVNPEAPAPQAQDPMRQALALARRALSGLGYGFTLDFLEDFLLLRGLEKLSEEERAARMDVVMRFQQLTGPIMAKGFEDTFLYCHARLLALNEVGGAPERFGVRPRELHAFLARRARDWPHTMNATASHDTKRGEDARMRLAVLSELPRDFGRAVRRWERLARDFKTRLAGRTMPDATDEYIVYQTLLGSWPMAAADRRGYVRRLQDHLLKAVREAKVHTSWVRPDEPYETALRDFLQGLLAEGGAFLADFEPLARRVALHGVWNSLAQLAVKLAAPGVPDFYQGSELLDFSFVDPDNRRPVDYDRRKTLLKDLATRAARNLPALLRSLLARPHDGRAKLFVAWRGLASRARRPQLFGHGTYVPLRAAGSRAAHVFCFARRHETEGWALAVVPRMTVRLLADVHQGALPVGEVWNDTRLVPPAGGSWPDVWEDALSGVRLEGPLRLDKVLGAFPVALLLSRQPAEE